MDENIAAMLIADARGRGATLERVKLICRPISEEDKRFPGSQDIGKARFMCSWMCDQ